MAPWHSELACGQSGHSPHAFACHVLERESPNPRKFTFRGISDFSSKRLRGELIYLKIIDAHMVAFQRIGKLA